MASVLQDETWREKPCLVLPGYRNHAGYAIIRNQGRARRAHRVAWEENFGAIPDGFHVLHYCDNPPCREPTHLFLGTHQINMNDRDAKGRHGWRLHPELIPRGSVRGNAKLTEQDIPVIRERAKSEKQQVIADDYGIARSRVSLILHRKIWSHVK